MNMTMRRKMTVCALALCGALALVADTGVVWNAADTGTSYAGGAVAVTRDAANKVVKLTVDPAVAGGLRFTGEAIAFSDAGGEVFVVSDGGLTFETALSSAGKISFTTSLDVIREWQKGDTAIPYEAEPAKPAVAVLTNASLEDFDVLYSVYSGAMSGYARPYHVVRTANSVTVQLQLGEESYTKCSKIKLTQSGSDVVAKVVYDRYTVYNATGEDFDTVTGAMTVWSYSPTHLRFIRAAGYVTVSLLGAVSAPAIDVAEGVAVYGDGDQALAGPGATFSCAVNVEGGRFGIRGRTQPLTLAMPVTGHNGDLDVIASAEELAAAPEAERTSAVVTFASGVNATTNFQINVSGAPSAEKVLYVTSKTVMPGTAEDWRNLGRVEVLSDGVLKLKATDIDPGHGINRYTTLTVRTGGKICDDRYFQFNTIRPIYLLGGCIELNGASKQDTDISEYLGKLVMRDGAVIKYARPRLGYLNLVPACYAVGSSPVTFDTGMVMTGVGYGSSETVCTFDIRDVTGDAAADLIMNGTLSILDADGYRRCIFCKKGAGTFLLNGTLEADYRPIRLVEGAFCLGCSGAVTAVSGVSLEGGSLATAAGTTNSVGPVSLSADSSIVVGAGASLAIADSSSAAWTAGKCLDIACDLDTSSIRFGTSAAGLTAAQLEQIRVNGAKVNIDDRGYLARRGLVLIYR